MKNIDLTRPDKLLLTGLKSLTNFSINLYSDEKSEAKGRGELAFIGEQKIEEVSTQLYQYDLETFQSQEQVFEFDFLNHENISKVSWLNFHGLHDVGLIQKLGKALDLDRITVRQTLDTTLRPKVEEYDHYLFFSIKSIQKNNEGVLEIEQMSFVLGKHYVVSFQSSWVTILIIFGIRSRKNLVWSEKRGPTSSFTNYLTRSLTITLKPLSP